MAEDVVYRLIEEEVISERESKLILAAVDRTTLHQPLPERDIIRARILQAMLVTLIYEQLTNTNPTNMRWLSMICENCKERPASVIITQESMVGSLERHLCEKCAFQTQTFHFDPNQEPLSIQQFLSHWFSGSDPFQAQQQTQENRQKDPNVPHAV